MSEVVNAHVQAIMTLPIVHASNPIRILEFYEKLLTHVQCLETMGKVNTIEGYVRNTLDKLPKIRSDLVRLDGEWRQWDFPKLIEALKPCVKKNSVTETGKEKPPIQREKNFNACQQNVTNWKCVFCDGTRHRINDCTEVRDPVKRRQIVNSKKFCFNCLKYDHRAADCSSRTCFKCNRKHHTSLCIINQLQDNSSNRNQETKEKAMTSLEEKGVCYPILVVNANGIQCRTLVDTGAGSSYALAALINRIGTSPVRRETRQMEMLLTHHVKKELNYTVSPSEIKRVPIS